MSDVIVYSRRRNFSFFLNYLIRGEGDLIELNAPWNESYRDNSVEER